MNKDITDYTYEELIDHCTGEAIMSLGKGKSMRDIMVYTVYIVNYWTWELAKKNHKEFKDEN